MGLRSAMPRPRFVDTVKERYYGVWLDLPCEREEAY